MNRFLQIVALAVAFGIVNAIELPEFIHVCARNDPNFVECIKESVEHLKQYMQKGVPEYNIPSLEPLLLKELVASEGTGIRITARDVKAYGASDFEITKLRVSLDEQKYLVDIALPHLHIEGLYEIDGRVLLLPIRGSGTITGNFSDCTGSVKVLGQVTPDSSGVEYLSITDFKLKISIGKGQLQLDNLFGGERVLGDVVNSAINSNFDAFIKELQPLIEKFLSEAFRDIADAIVRQFTFEQLFPIN